MAKGKYEAWLTEDGLLCLQGWARDGLTDEQIAHNCGVNTATLYDWKKRYPKISEALKTGKGVVDIQVENALLKRALGYSYTETKVEKSVKDGMKTTMTVKEVLPDVTAQIFWLKNRKRDAWRDRTDIRAEVEDAAGKAGVVLLPAVMTVPPKNISENKPDD